MTNETRTVTVKVSKPYIAIAGGWTGMRPVGRKRDYRATFEGHDIKRTSKSEIQQYIRQLAYVAGVKVKFEFIEDE